MFNPSIESKMERGERQLEYRPDLNQGKQGGLSLWLDGL